jgi:hypothetical protein
MKPWRFFPALLILALLINLGSPAFPVKTGAASSVLAQPPQQSSDPYQLCATIKEFVATLNPQTNDFLCSGDVNTDIKYNYKIYAMMYRDQLDAKGHVESGVDPIPYPIGDQGIEYYMVWSDKVTDYTLVFRRGCRAISMASRSRYDGSDTGMVPIIRNTAAQIDAKLQALPDQCPTDTSGEKPPPAQPDTSEFKLVGLGCSGDPAETGAVGRVVCTPSIAGEPKGASATFAWELDNKPLSDTSRTLTVDNVSSGDHQVGVTVTLGGVQKGYSGWVSVLDDSNASSFKIIMDCQVDQVNIPRLVDCEVYPMDGRSRQNLTYEWYWDGAKLGGQEASISRNDVDDNQHTVQVKGTDPDKKEVSAFVSYVIPAVKSTSALPSPGQLQVTSTNSAAVVSPGQQTSTTMQPGEKTQVSAKCEQVLDYYILLTLINQDKAKVKKATVQTKRGPIVVHYLSFVLLCLKYYGAEPADVAYAPLHSGMASLAPLGKIRDWFPLYLPTAPPASADDPISVKLSLPEGTLYLQTSLDKMTLEVQTATGSVVMHGKGDLQVNYDAVNSQSLVAVYQGAASIQPVNTTLQAVTLQGGQAVVVGKDSVSELMSVTQTATTVIPTLVWLAGAVCMGTVALLAVIILLSQLTRKPRLAEIPAYPYPQQSYPPQGGYPPQGYTPQPGGYAQPAPPQHVTYTPPQAPPQSGYPPQQVYPYPQQPPPQAGYMPAPYAAPPPPQSSSHTLLIVAVVIAGLIVLCIAVLLGVILLRPDLFGLA